MTRIRCILVVAALLALGVACRPEEPVGDPKTPANSPIPNIDKKDEDPKSSPSPKLPFGGDAG